MAWVAMAPALLQGNNIWWASVGDSHLYLVRNRELNKINADHSYGGFLDAMSKAGTPVEPEPGLARNMLMSAITGVDIADIDCPTSPLQLKHGDRIIICSDGMDTLSDGKIIQYSDWSESPKECVDALLNAVEEAESPKQDNNTGLMIGIAAAVIIAVGIGGFFMLGKEKAPTTILEPDTTSITPAEPEEEIATEVEPEEVTEEPSVEEIEPAAAE